MPTNEPDVWMARRTQEALVIRATPDGHVYCLPLADARIADWYSAGADAVRVVRRATYEPVNVLARVVSADPGRPHRAFRVYIGPDADHRAYVGCLTLTIDEALLLVALLAPDPEATRRGVELGREVDVEFRLAAAREGDGPRALRGGGQRGSEAGCYG